MKTIIFLIVLLALLVGCAGNTTGYNRLSAAGQVLGRQEMAAMQIKYIGFMYAGYPFLAETLWQSFNQETDSLGYIAWGERYHPCDEN